jgi:hypothetical protein
MGDQFEVMVLAFKINIFRHSIIMNSKINAAGGIQLKNSAIN